MQDNYTTKGKHLTIDSRRLIERWKKEGKSNREIASLLGKAPQTIHTKIKRRTVRKCLGKGRFKEVYSADYAQQSYENNRKHSVKRSSVTKELKEKILHYHNQKFLPEMMVSSCRHKKTPLCYTCCSTTNTRKAQKCKTIILQKVNI
ncbi:transposase [Streptococcus pneumoniae]|nr:transposase [Streptococcus pneumoniae]